MFWLGPDHGWFGVANLAFLVVVVIAAVVLLRRELPSTRVSNRKSPALRLLEERYARGEISREDFLHRRSVLLHASGPMAAAPASPPPVESSPGETPGEGPEAETPAPWEEGTPPEGTPGA